VDIGPGGWERAERTGVGVAGDGGNGGELA